MDAVLKYSHHIMPKNQNDDPGDKNQFASNDMKGIAEVLNDVRAKSVRTGVLLSSTAYSLKEGFCFGIDEKQASTRDVVGQSGFKSEEGGGVDLGPATIIESSELHYISAAKIYWQTAVGNHTVHAFVIDAVILFW